MRIYITMNSGRTMRVEAEWYADELYCYWPGKGKRREIPSHLYDYNYAMELADAAYHRSLER